MFKFVVTVLLFRLATWIFLDNTMYFNVANKSMLSYLLLTKNSSSTDELPIVRTCVCVFVQVVYTKLDQAKNNLLATCKTLMRRAREICNMTPGETTVPEELHAVSSVYLRHPTSFIQPLIHYFKTFCALFPLRPSASCLIHWMRLMPCWMRRRPEPSASPDSVMLWDKRISLFTLSLTSAFQMLLINLYFTSYWKLTSRRGISNAQSILQCFTRTLAYAYNRTHRISEWNILHLRCTWTQADDTLIYIYTFSRRFYPKRLSAFRLYIFLISMCVPWELNPRPFALLTQCSTTEPQKHSL